MQVLSKFQQVPTSCIEYVHPWTDSCWNGTAGLLLVSAADSFRIYFVVYMLSLLMRGRIPTMKDIQKTFLSIIQSTAFLTTNAFSYSMYLCILHRIFGGFNMYTAAYIPAFMASLTAILVERPSRRNLLTLYVCNVATETLWRMGVYRNMVSPVKFGEIIIFGVSTALLSYYFKRGLHLEVKESIFDVLRFVVGKEEFQQEPALLPAQQQAQQAPPPPRQRRTKTNHYLIVQKLLTIYQQALSKLKNLPKSEVCPHDHSCVYYVLGGTTKLFSIGLLMQVTLKLILQLNKIAGAPSRVKKILLNRDTLKIGAFLGGFTGIYRASVCLLRTLTKRDCASYSIPATLLASTSFMNYSNNSAALYVMWKTLQITYNLLENRGFVPKIPGFMIFLYCASTATLFHAAIMEPMNLRPSYWKFLHGLSGGRVGVMDRSSFNCYGLSTTDQISQVLAKTNTLPQLKSLLGNF